MLNKARVGIRQYTRDDVDELYNVIKASAEHLKTYMLWYHKDYSIDDTRNWVNLCIADEKANSAFRYLIYDYQKGDIIGATGIEKIDSERKVGELGYWVASDFSNQGVVTDAARQTICTAFALHELRRIEIIIHPENKPSNRVAEKLGALFEGKLRNKLVHRGHSIDANCYSLIPSDMTGLDFKRDVVAI